MFSPLREDSRCDTPRQEFRNTGVDDCLYHEVIPRTAENKNQGSCLILPKMVSINDETTGHMLKSTCVTVPPFVLREYSPLSRRAQEPNQQCTQSQIYVPWAYISVGLLEPEA